MAKTTKQPDWKKDWPAGEYLHKDPDYVEGTHEAENPEERVLRHVWPKPKSSKSGDKKHSR